MRIDLINTCTRGCYLMGVNWQVGETNFNFTMPRDSLDVLGSGMFSRYTPAMLRMNRTFAERSDYDPKQNLIIQSVFSGNIQQFCLN